MKKLKPQHQRKPDTSVPFYEIISEVAKDTGYVRSDVETVLLKYLEVIKFHLLDRKRVRLRDIGELYPVVKPARQVRNMGGSNLDSYEAMMSEPKWKLVFTTVESMEKEVADILVTQRDLSNIYK
jgi:nucleoid DNA-binding protein